MAEQRESHGPDRCHGSIRCIKFHGYVDTSTGTGTGIEADQQCCCCDPCLHVRQDVRAIDALTAYQWCCRCVPRVIFLRFVPDNADDPCCQGVITPMFHNRAWGTGPISPEDPLWSTYSGSLFGYYVYIALGRITETTGTGLDDLGSCGWYIRVEHDGATVYERSILLGEYNINSTGTGTGTGTDIAVADCLTVPLTVIAEGVTPFSGDTETGTAGSCTGTLVLENASKSKLPFVEDATVRDFIDSHSTGTVGDNPHFIHLCDQCETGELPSLSGVAVDGLTYLVDGQMNGKPYFVNGGNRIYWDGDVWVLVDTVGPGTGTGTAAEDWTELAIGPTDEDCPFGVWERTDAWTGTGTGRADDQCFCVTHLANAWLVPCGCCGSVCSRICVRGPRHLADPTTPFDFKTFSWFETWTATGTGTASNQVSRGWFYANPETERTEYVYLEEDADFSILVDGIAWDRNYGVHSFGDPAWSYWRGTIDSQEAWIYRSWTGYWALMIGGNEEATGPTSDSPIGTYIPDSGTSYVIAAAPGYQTYGCRLRPQFEEDAASELYPPKLIDMDRGCGSDLFVVLPRTGGAVTDSTALHIRCGFCSCWRHWCGLCRCVPTDLCVIYFNAGGETGTGTASILVNNLTLTWNPDVGGWGDEDDPLRLLLQRSETTGGCVIVPDIPGYTAPTSKYVAYDCGDESWTKDYEPESDFIAITYEDYTEGNNIFIVARSHAPNCLATPCQEGQATPCGDACGGHPLKLYATFTVYPAGDGGEAPPRPPYTLDTVTLYFISTVATITPGIDGGIWFDCGYYGIIPGRSNGSTVCCAFGVYLTGNGLFVYPKSAQYSCADWDSSDSFDLSAFHAPSYTGITCNPYYAEGVSVSAINIIHQHCLHPEYDGTNGEYGSMSVVITE